MRVADSLDYIRLIESRNRNKEGGMKNFTMIDPKSLANPSALCHMYAW